MLVKSLNKLNFLKNTFVFNKYSNKSLQNNMIKSN